MTPSEVRSRVLAEHVWLSQKISRLESSADRCLCGTPGELPRLQAMLGDLFGSLRRHLSTEEEILLPLLRQVDAWGDLRAEQVRRDHEAQRREMQDLERVAETAPPEELADAALELCATLREDMDTEERVTLSPRVLRDDVVAVDQLDA